MTTTPKLVGSRVVVRPNYAVLPPEGWVLSVLPGWGSTEATILAAPALGAKFVQYMLTIAKGGGAEDSLGPGIEAFFHVLEGEIELELEPGSHRLSAGGFAYLEPGASFRVSGASARPARVLWLKKRYEALGEALPSSLAGNEIDIKGDIYMGIDGLLLKTLIPDHQLYDMAMNIFTFQPGRSLPMIETHVMEHGLYF